MKINFLLCILLLNLLFQLYFVVLPYPLFYFVYSKLSSINEKVPLYVIPFFCLILAFYSNFFFIAWSLNFNYTYSEGKIIGKCPKGEGRGLKIEYIYEGKTCQRCFLTDNYSYEDLYKKKIFKVRVPAFSPITGARIEWE